MASGSQNMTTYNARIVTGSNNAASPAGALLLSGAGRADDATGDTWIFLNSLRGTTNPWGIKHDQANNKLQIFGSGTNSVSVRMNTGDTYILGKVGIGYDPETSGNTYKLYVNGTSFFNDNIYLGVNKDLYMQYNDTMYGILHNHNNGNISVNATGNGLFLGFYNTAFINWMDGRMQLKDGCLSIFPNTTNYREGMRIHSVSSWSGITLCGNDNTEDTGISANSWYIGNNDGNLYIARNGSPGSTAWLECVNNIWSTMNPLWIKGGSTEAGADANRLTTSAGMPGNMQYNTSRRGTQIYSNGIAFADPYNGNNNNDAGWIRHIEETANTGIFEFAVGDDNSNEAIVFRRYTTSNTVGKEAYIFDASGNSSFPGTVTSVGTIASTAGYLKSTVNGNTVQIGSQNSGCCHIYNSKNIPFAFSHGIFCVNQGDLGTTTYPFHQLVLGGATNATMTAASTNPRITFQENTGVQPVHILYCDWDSYRSPAGLKIIGGASASPAWFEVEGNIYAAKVYNAVWNDYAEYRQAESIEPGRVFTESTSGIMKITTKRLMPACKISSDTFGTCMGETSNAKTPIAVAGRVLVYPYRARTEYELGAAVCSAPNGTIDIMTREEIMKYPERIVGIVSEIPNYEIWHAGAQDGDHEIQVNGRIWIYVR